jgi:hypothetical protein
MAPEEIRERHAAKRRSKKPQRNSRSSTNSQNPLIRTNAIRRSHSPRTPSRAHKSLLRLSRCRHESQVTDPQDSKTCRKIAPTQPNEFVNVTECAPSEKHTEIFNLRPPWRPKTFVNGTPPKGTRKERQSRCRCLVHETHPALWI